MFSTGVQIKVVGSLWEHKFLTLSDARHDNWIWVISVREKSLAFYLLIKKFLSNINFCCCFLVQLCDV